MEEDVAGGWMLLCFGVACFSMCDGVFDELINKSYRVESDLRFDFARRLVSSD